jgi:hypothetical protein
MIAMSKSKGRNLPVSPFRRLVADLMRVSQQVPAVTIERYMNLAELVEARQAVFPRPTWTGIFAKAYAILGRDYPELRRSYMTFPWARFYEHPHNIATLNIERKVGDESVVLYCLIKSPENRSLAEIDALIHHHKEAPIEEVRSFQRSMTLAKCPPLVRRLVWWTTLRALGRRRCHNFGTFGLTTVAAHGAGVLQLVPLLTSTIFYSLFDKEGGLTMRLAWDHRVFDGTTAAHVLTDLEAVLKREILQECRQRQRAAA